MSRVGLFGQISEINGHLYLSGAGVLQPDKLRQKKITSIINATTEEPDAHLAGIDYLKIRIDDHPDAHIERYFDMVADRIKSTKENGGKTLVHCVAGVSRSASFCIVYLIKHERMTLRQAYLFVKSARPIIRPNVGFWRRMIDFEMSERGRNTVTFIRGPRGTNCLIPDLYYADDMRAARCAQVSASNSASSPLFSASSSSTYSNSVDRPQRRYAKSVPASTNGLISNGLMDCGLRKSATNALYSYGNGFSNTNHNNNNNNSYRSYSRRSISPAAYSFSGSSGYASSSYPARSKFALPSQRYANTSLFSPPISRTNSTINGNKKHHLHKKSSNGNIFSSIYETSQDILFPSF